MIDFYDQEARKYGWRGDYLAPYIQAVWDMAAVKAGDTVLDVGCGAGYLVRRCAAHGARALGVDVSGFVAAYARRGGAEVSIATAYSLPFASGVFDVVILSEILEHLETPEVALSEVGRVLRPDGRVVVSVPNDRNTTIYKFLLGLFDEAFRDKGHVNDLGSIEKITHLVAKTPFVVNQVMNVHLGIPLIPFMGLPVYFASKLLKPATGLTRVSKLRRLGTHLLIPFPFLATNLVVELRLRSSSSGVV